MVVRASVMALFAVARDNVLGADGKLRPSASLLCLKRMKLSFSMRRYISRIAVLNKDSGKSDSHAYHQIHTKNTLGNTESFQINMYGGFKFSLKFVLYPIRSEKMSVNINFE